MTEIQEKHYSQMLSFIERNRWSFSEKAVVRGLTFKTVSLPTLSKFMGRALSKFKVQSPN